MADKTNSGEHESKSSPLEFKQAEKIIDAIQNEHRFSILSYLIIYNELTLSNLAEYLNRSKSTIHYHISKLLDIGLVQVAREDKKDEGGTIRPIKTKYYTYNKQLLDESDDAGLHFEQSDVEKLESETRLALYEQVLNAMKTIRSFLMNNLDLGFEFLENIFPESADDQAVFKQLEHALHKYSFELEFFTEDKYQIYEEEYEKFRNRLKERFKNNKKENKKQRTIIRYTIELPIKRILDGVFKQRQRKQ